MGTLHHHLTEVHGAVKEVRQALITLIAPKAAREGIINLIIPECIFIIRMLITTIVKHGIAKRVIFVV